MPAPHGGDAVLQRQRGVGIGGDVEHRKIIHHEGIGKATKRDGDEHQLALRRGPRQIHPRLRAARGARERQRALRHREDEREHQGELTEFWNHRLAPPETVFTAF